MLTHGADADADDEFEPPEHAGEDDEVEPLEIVPYPVAIEAHDPEVGGDSVVRLFFQPGDLAAAPEVDLAEVVILEPSIASQSDSCEGA